MGLFSSKSKSKSKNDNIKSPTLVWESLTNYGGPRRAIRTKIIGGWLLSTCEGSLTFIPDPNHDWDGNSIY